MKADHTMCTCGHSLSAHKLVERNFKSDGKGELVEISAEEATRVFVGRGKGGWDSSFRDQFITRRSQPCVESGCMCLNWAFDRNFFAPEAMPVAPATRTSSGETVFPGLPDMGAMARERIAPTLKPKIVVRDMHGIVAEMSPGDRINLLPPSFDYMSYVCECGHSISAHTQEVLADGRFLDVCMSDDCGCASFRSQSMNGNGSAVDHPAHYGGKDNPYETIKVIDAWQLDFYLGNCVKYISRAGKKDPMKELEDLQKAAFYLNYRIEQLKQTK